MSITNDKDVIILQLMKFLFFNDQNICLSMAGLGPAVPRSKFWCLIDLATRP